MNLSTFSLVARDPSTGKLAVAGGTNWFNYGRRVPHAQAGIGAVATQAETNMEYAASAIAAMKSGQSATKTLDSILETSPDEEGIYQLLLLDAEGNTACSTGKRNHEFAGHILKKDFGTAGNTLVSKATPEAVAAYYENSTEDFCLKIINALQAGQNAGGDIRGMKSAALKIVKPVSSGKYWEDTVFDLRVDCSTNPLKELESLYYVAEAYRYIGEAEEAADPQEALRAYLKALTFDATNEEIRFWIAWTYNRLGDKTKALELLNKLGKNWKEYWTRLVKRGS